jgi:tRNA/tmRNA/rRNA uracil-C5-methylase (TrmA/RlmC/RlmD family)
VELFDGPPTLRHRLRGFDFDVASAGFWQVHPAAGEAFAAALLEAVRPEPGERVLDLYAGAGALTAVLAAAVGRAGSVLSIEADRQAVVDAAANLAGLPQVSVTRGKVTPATLGRVGTPDGRVDIVALDPPRAGAGRDVMNAILELRPRVVGYVACDPAALARDVATARDAGWQLTSLSAFDAFPMTAHVECVAALEPLG